MISAITFPTRYVLASCLALAVLLLVPYASGLAQPIPSGTIDTVTTLIDELDASADPSLGAGTSFREAVEYSAAGDRIVFDAGLTGTVFLTLGEVLISHDLIINGPGSSIIELNGNDLSRIIRVDTSTSVILSGLTLASGRAVDGAAIFSEGWLSVLASSVRWSTAIQRGGAIYHDGDTLRLIGSRFERCEAYIHGGAVAVAGGEVFIDSDIFDGNTAGGNGGALYYTNTAVHAGSSTFSDNTASGSGGAIAVGASASLTLVRSTINGNRASNGGGIQNGGTVTITSSTISGNTADNSGGGVRNSGTFSSDFATIAFNSATMGGGVLTTGTFSPSRTLIAENTAATGADVHGAATSGSTNLVAIADGSSGWVGGDITGTASKPVDASLDDLRLNGGQTKTHALLICSRAIDAADSTGTWNMTDQRGQARKVNGDNDGIAVPDIGAYESLSILDVTAPEIVSHPAFKVYLDSTGHATITKDTLLLNAFDNCEVVSTYASKLNFSCADIGMADDTLKATDRSHNTATKVIQVEVIDDTPPTLTVPADKFVNASSSSCGVTLTAAQLGTATATDGCGGVTISNNAPSEFPVGLTLVLWQAEDGSGNVSYGQQYVTVTDATAPSITPPADISVRTPGNACYVLAANLDLGIPTASDNCSVEVTNDAPAQFPLGATVVVWTATDPAGNMSQANQTVTVIDSTAPVIFAPADLALVSDIDSCSRAGANVNLGSPTASDNCAGVIVTNDKPASFPIGETSVTWTATDAAGNVALAVQKVTIFDGNPPTVIAPPDIEVPADSGTCAWAVVPSILGTATSTDNCSIPTVTNSAGSSLGVGTHRVIWTALDGNSNRSTDVQIVTVVGDPPSIVCRPDTTVNTDPGKAGAVVTFLPPIAASGCSEIEIIRTSGLGSGDFFPVGTTNVAYMAIDGSNQIAVCDFDVTVEDHENPQISVNVAPRILWPADNNMYEIKATVVVWDNVPGASAVLTSIICNQPAAGDIAGATLGVFDEYFELRAKNINAPRTYTVTYTATDVAGNTASDAAVVSVPTQKPKDFEEEILPAPSTVTLAQNYPNPFNPTTLITFGIPAEQHIELRIYNAMGVPVRTLVSTQLPAGTYTMQWDGTDDNGLPLSSGVYLYMLRSGGDHLERKMILAR